MLEYSIVPGTRVGAIEISFNEKPCEIVRNALKTLKMRWNGKKSVWYGFVTEDMAKNAIQNASEESTQVVAKKQEDIEKEFYTTVEDGYLRANKYVGSKSHEFLYGSKLSKAVRQDLKRCGIKATTRCETYSMGQTLTVTLEINKDDFVPKEEYIAQFKIWEHFSSVTWLYLPEFGQIRVDDFMCRDTITDEQRESARVYLASEQYAKYWNSGVKNADGYAEFIDVQYQEKCNILTESANKRIDLVKRIVNAYRHDDSNSMVDYFDTNFYYDIYLKNIDGTKEGKG